MTEITPPTVAATDAATRDDLAVIMRFILRQYLRPETLRRLTQPIKWRPAVTRHEGVVNGDIDPLAEILVTALVEHLHQNGFVVERRERWWG